MTKTDERRLDRIERALSPKEAVLLWMAEAHQHGSIQAYVDSLNGQPEQVFPLMRLGQQMEDSVRASVKGSGEREIEIWPKVVLAVRDAAFLYYLTSQAKWRVMEQKRANWLNIA